MLKSRKITFIQTHRNQEERAFALPLGIVHFYPIVKKKAWLKWNKTTSGPAPFGSTSQGQVETLTVTEQSPADAERRHRPCDNPAVPPLTVPLEQASKDLAHRPGGSHSSLGKPLRHFVLTGFIIYFHRCLSVRQTGVRGLTRSISR